VSKHWHQLGLPVWHKLHDKQAQRRTKKQIKHYKLLEIKYCRDTDPSQQENRAEHQHKRLMKALQIFNPNARVTLTTITLGVSGCIYKRTVNQLKELGIVGPTLTRLLKKLHHLAGKHNQFGTRVGQLSQTDNDSPGPLGIKGNLTCTANRTIKTGNDASSNNPYGA
jgi:hypothetical protein